jgi:hypothetical protein
LPPWRCKHFNSVLNTNLCALDFFTDYDGAGPDLAGYELQEVYNAALSGAANMAFASERTFVGNHQITFGAANHIWP